MAQQVKASSSEPGCSPVHQVCAPDESAPDWRSAFGAVLCSFPDPRAEAQCKLWQDRPAAQQVSGSVGRGSSIPA
jgi:hypothetical protein